MHRANRDNLVSVLEILGRHEDLDELALDEHRRYALYSEALMAVAPDRERQLLASVVEDPDKAMRESVIVKHIDRLAARRVSLADFAGWYQPLRDLLDAASSARLRGDEWLIAKRLDEAGGNTANEDINAWSDWLQRKLSAEASSRAVLALLAESGRTRRIRSAAQRRLQSLRS